MCASKLAIIGLGYGVLPKRRQAIILTSAGRLLIGPLETDFNNILIKIQSFLVKKMPLKMSSTKFRPFCVGLNG